MTLNPSNIHHRRLQHLHSASRLLFPIVPSVSAYYALKLYTHAQLPNINIPLSDAVFRSQCACCGYLLVPGWTASVSVKGYAVDSERERKVKLDVRDEMVARTPAQQTKATVVAGKKRKRGKRTRGHGGSKSLEGKQVDITATAQHDEKIKSPPLRNANSTTISAKDAKDPKSTEYQKPKSQPLKSQKIQTPMVSYKCLLCDRKTTQSLPLSTTINTTPSSSPLPQTPLSSKLTTTPPPPPSLEPSSALNASSRKRAKTRKKSTLASMLSRDRQRANSSDGGNLGLDLMDLMKTN